MALLRRIGRPGRGRRAGRTLAILVLASLTLLAIGRDSSGPAKNIRSAFAVVFRPVRSAADSAFTPVVDTWHGITRYSHLQKENDRLRREVAHAKGDGIRQRVQRQQIAELRRLRGTKFLGDLPSRTARVVSGPPSSFDRTIQIDLGSGDGVKRNMAVVTDAGLVGKVARSDASSSDVTLITDPGFEVGFQLRVAKALGVAHGNGQGKPLVMEDGSVRPGANVSTGDDVTTSGLASSTFPADIPIGVVQSAHKATDENQLSLRIRPVADLGSLRYVLVILRDPPS